MIFLLNEQEGSETLQQLKGHCLFVLLSGYVC